MIDLDTLAENRAKILNQSGDAWLRILWSPEFQLLSGRLSDGEVEKILSSCMSVAHVEFVIAFLEKHPSRKTFSPFSILMSECESSGLGLKAWIAKRTRTG